MTITRYNVCKESLVTSSVIVELLGDCVGWDTDTLPTWFEFDSDRNGCQNNYWFNTPNVAGEYVAEYQVSRTIGDSQVVIGTGKIIINVLAQCEVFNTRCCGVGKTIAWLTREGGWRSFTFAGVTTFSVEVDGGEQFTNQSNERRWAERGGYYDGLNLTTKVVNKSEVDLLASLKTSVQAYLWNDDTSAFDIAVKLKSGNFTKYRSRNDILDESITLIIAKQNTIQRQ